jgi:hypothetical protein
MSLKSYYYEIFSKEVRRLPLKDEIYGATRFFGGTSTSFPWEDVEENVAAVNPTSNELFIASLFTCVSIDMLLHHEFCLVKRNQSLYQGWDAMAQYPKFGMTCMGAGWSRNPLFILKCAESKQVISAEKMLPIMPEITKLIQEELQEALDRFFPGQCSALNLLGKWCQVDPTFGDANTDCATTVAFRAQLRESLQNNA